MTHEPNRLGERGLLINEVQGSAKKVKGSTNKEKRPVNKVKGSINKVLMCYCYRVILSLTQ